MKNGLKIILAAITLGLFSCSSSDDDNSQYLTFELGSKSGILIPAPATTQSCEQLSKGETSTGSVTGAYFSLGNPNFRWTLDDGGLSEVRIVAVKLTMKSPKVGGEYSCIFSDVALGSLYYKITQSAGGNVTEIWNGILGKSGNKTLTSAKDLITSSGYTGCNLKCGSITIPTGTGVFSVTGTWEVLGVQKKYKSADSTDYKELPLKVQGDFTVESLLN